MDRRSKRPIGAAVEKGILEDSLLQRPIFYTGMTNLYNVFILQISQNDSMYGKKITF